jgi:hypothetical protein
MPIEIYYAIPFTFSRWFRYLSVPDYVFELSTSIDRFPNDQIQTIFVWYEALAFQVDIRLEKKLYYKGYESFRYCPS